MLIILSLSVSGLSLDYGISNGALDTRNNADIPTQLTFSKPFTFNDTHITNNITSINIGSDYAPIVFDFRRRRRK